MIALEIFKNLIELKAYGVVILVLGGVIAILILLPNIYEALMVSWLNKLLKEPKEQRMTETLQLVLLYIFLADIQFFSYYDKIDRVVFGVVGFVGIAFWGGNKCVSKHKTPKNSEAKNLDINKEEKKKRYVWLGKLAAILYLFPCIYCEIGRLLCAKLNFDLQHTVCVLLIGTVLQMVIFCLEMMGFVQRKDGYYICIDGEKNYLYKRIDEENVLCGDEFYEDKANRFRVVNMRVLQNQKINRYDIEKKGNVIC